MAYFGKEFAFEREENYEEFIAAIVPEEDQAKQFLSFHPNQKIEKDGDNYKLVFILPNGEKSLSFQNGATVNEEVLEGVLEAKTTFTVEGDTIEQVQDFGEQGAITYKREYTGNQLKVTLTSNKWDGVAYRWYTAL